MKVQLTIIGLFILLLIAACTGVLPMLWSNVIICYIGSSIAAGVLIGARPQ